MANEARSWNPNFHFSDRERWICVYPAYVNGKRTLAEGRRVPKKVAIDNPLYTEIRDVCAAAGMTLGVEKKAYPRDRDPRDKGLGRIRIQLKRDDGSPCIDKYPTRDSILLYICEAIPRLKTRTNPAPVAQQSAAPTGSKKQQKKNARKGKH